MFACSWTNTICFRCLHAIFIFYSCHSCKSVLIALKITVKQRKGEMCVPKRHKALYCTFKNQNFLNEKLFSKFDSRTLNHISSVDQVCRVHLNCCSLQRKNEHCFIRQHTLRCQAMSIKNICVFSKTLLDNKTLSNKYDTITGKYHTSRTF